MKGPRTKTGLRGRRNEEKEREGKEKLSSIAIAPQNRNNQSRLSYDYGNNDSGRKEGRNNVDFFYEMSGRKAEMDCGLLVQDRRQQQDGTCRLTQGFGTPL